MNLHGKIPGTLALWQFQNSLNDSGDLGLHLSSVHRTTHAPVASPNFVTMSTKANGITFNDGCLVGVDLVDADYPSMPVLMGPLTPILQITGPATWEWIMMQKGTYNGTYICCADPSGRSGGSAPDRIGSLYTLFWDTGPERAGMTDQHIGSNTPSPGYRDFQSATITNWAGTDQPTIGDWSAHHFAYVRDGSGNWLVYRDGVVVGAGILSAGTNVATGVERTFIGLCEGGGDGGVGVYASMRIVNYARSAAQIAADAAFTLATCGGGGPSQTPAVPPYTTSANPGSSGIFIPNEIDDRPILRGRAGLALQTGFKERAPEGSNNIYCIKNIRAAAQAATVYRQSPRIWPLPDDGRST